MRPRAEPRRERSEPVPVRFCAHPLLSHQKVCAGKVRLDQTHDGVQASHVEDWEACGKQAWINNLRKDIADYLASAAQVATKREELDALNKLEGQCRNFRVWVGRLLLFRPGLV